MTNAEYAHSRQFWQGWRDNFKGGMMTEKDYITASNLTRLRLIVHILGDMIPNKDLTEEQLGSFRQWAHRMVDRHHARIEGLKP